MTTICEGLRVLDLTEGLAGMLATMLLADNGAEVVKVEPPGGDPLRARPAWVMWNRGKQSLALDLNTAEGKAEVARLAARADVVIEDFAPDTMDGLGLGYEALARGNERLVYCAITAFGTKGPYRNLPRLDGVVEARGGGYADLGNSMWMRPETGPAYRARPNPSFTAANLAVQGIIAALFAREQSGRGQKVETSLFQALGCYDFMNSLPRQYPLNLAWRPGGNPTSPSMGGVRVNLTYLVARCKDGQWIQLTNNSLRLFQNLMRTIGLGDVIAQPGYQGMPTSWPSDEARRAVADQILEKMQQKTLEEWLPIFAQHDVAGERFLSTQQLLDYEQAHAINGVAEVDDPSVGKSTQIGQIVQFYDTPAQIGRPAPALGEHAANLWEQPSAATAGANGRSGGQPAAPFEGMLVLDFANWLAAPAGTSLIADLGARVLKIEPPNGDDVRNGVAEGGKSRMMMGKESVVIDLKTPEGQRVIKALLKKSHGLMTNMRGDIPARLGLDYESVRALNPNIVYLYAGSYGSKGPGAGRPAFHPTAGALSGGVLWQLGNGNDVPNDILLAPQPLYEQSVRLLQANEGSPDLTSAAVVGTAMALGLYALKRTGEGQYIESTMMMSNAWMCSDDFIRYEGKPERTPVDRYLRGLHALHRLYKTADGWVFLTCPTEAEWQALCSAIGKPELLQHAWFSDPEVRRQHDQQLIAALAPVFLSRTADEWERDLLAANVPCVRADRPSADVFLTDEFVKENGFIQSVEHPGIGGLQRWGPFWQFSATPARTGPPHLFGEDTPALLQELGFSNEEIADWRQRKIVVWEEPVAV